MNDAKTKVVRLAFQTRAALEAYRKKLNEPGANLDGSQYLYALAEARSYAIYCAHELSIAVCAESDLEKLEAHARGKGGDPS